MEALYAAANEKTGRLVAEREGVKGVIDFLDREISRAEGLVTLRDDGAPPVHGFLYTLFYLILSKPPAEVHCQWSADGNYVVVLDAVAFASEVCPRYYRHSNFDSFKKNMNLYGFVKSKRTNCGSRRHVFSHEHFLKGREDLLARVKSSQSGKGSRGPQTIRRAVRAAEATSIASAPAEDAAPAPSPTTRPPRVPPPVARPAPPPPPRDARDPVWLEVTSGRRVTRGSIRHLYPGLSDADIATLPKTVANKPMGPNQSARQVYTYLRRDVDALAGARLPTVSGAGEMSLPSPAPKMRRGGAGWRIRAV